MQEALNVPNIDMDLVKKNFQDPPEVQEEEPTLPEGVLKVPDEPFEVHLTRDNFRVKTVRNKGTRMKFQLVLTEDQAQGFRNYVKTFKPDDMHLDDFVRFLFFTGMESYNQKVNEAVQKQIEAGAEVTIAHDADEALPPVEDGRVDVEIEPDAGIGR